MSLIKYVADNIETYQYWIVMLKAYTNNLFYVWLKASSHITLNI